MKTTETTTATPKKKESKFAKRMRKEREHAEFMQTEEIALESIWPKPTVESLRRQGKSPAAIVYVEQIYSSIPYNSFVHHPDNKNYEDRNREYSKVVRDIKLFCDEIKTNDDILKGKDFVEENGWGTMKEGGSFVPADKMSSVISSNLLNTILKYRHDVKDLESYAISLGMGQYPKIDGGRRLFWDAHSNSYFLADKKTKRIYKSGFNSIDEAYKWIEYGDEPKTEQFMLANIDPKDAQEYITKTAIATLIIPVDNR